MISLKGNERVLVCPLGWGLGHATRVIPIISDLKEKGCPIIVAADQSSIDLVRSQFSDLHFILFPSLNVKLSKGKTQIIALFKLATKLIVLTLKEQYAIRGLVAKHNINIILSDNRYGLYSKNVYSILITHQLKVIFPQPFKWAEPIAQWYIRRYANRFSECWIPDNSKGFRLSGDLSRPKILPKNIRFIGILSRFAGIKIAKQKVAWDLVGIVSGPPPHREIFEKTLLDLSNRLGLKSLIIQGLPNSNQSEKIIGNAMLVSHLPVEEMANAIDAAKVLICRSGYSTIMDLVSLGKKALLVPTPGQTEQEYLAKYLAEQKLFMCITQEELKNVSSCFLKNLSS